MWRLVIPFALVAAGCWTTRRPAPPPPLPPPTARPQPSGVGPSTPPVLPPQATATAAAGDDALPPIDPLIRLHEVHGASPGDAAILFDELPERLEKCRGNPGGVVKLHFASRSGKVSAELRSSDAAPGTTQCILEAIAFDSDEATSPSNSPSERTRDVESMVTISW